MYVRSAPFVTPARAPLAQLLHDLRALGDLRRHAAAVDARLDGFAPPVAELVRHVAWPRRGYARTLAHRDEAFELLLLGWAPGSRAPLHDHAGQDCWFLPLAGAFELEHETIHAVTPTTPLALSLHLYARPLDRCRVYDLARNTWSWRRLRYDAVAPQIGE